MDSGIYAIKNALSSKIYIGSSFDVNKRIAQHKYALKSGSHINKEMQVDWDINSDSFDFEVLEKCEDKELSKKEQKYIDRFDYDSLYNVLTVNVKRKSKSNPPNGKKLRSLNLDDEIMDKLKKIGLNEFGSTNMSAAVSFLVNNYKEDKK